MNKTVWIFLFSVSALLSVYSQEQRLTSRNLLTLEGAKWVGTLTYVDYRSNKKTSIKSELIIKKSPTSDLSWIFDYQYPDEPRANNSSTVTLTASGDTFNDQRVSGKSNTKDGLLRFVGMKDGTDNDRNAIFRYTYLIGPKSFSVRKEVKLEGSTEWFERHEYSWSR